MVTKKSRKTKNPGGGGLMRRKCRGGGSPKRVGRHKNLGPGGRESVGNYVFFRGGGGIKYEMEYPNVNSYKFRK